MRFSHVVERAHTRADRETLGPCRSCCLEAKTSMISMPAWRRRVDADQAHLEGGPMSDALRPVYVAVALVAAVSPMVAAQRITVGPNVHISVARPKDAHSE